MKKALALVLTVTMLAVMLAACGGSGSSGTGAVAGPQPTDASSAVSGSQAAPAAAGDTKKIGVLQLAPHAALDAAYEGFVDGLAEEGFVDGENIAIDYQNAQGDIANCSTIASKLVNDGDDLIFAIATPAAQAAANATGDIPIVVTAVTDLVEANLAESNDAPGGNVTGTSDLTPVREQMELLQQLVPDAQKVGFLYCSSEANSIIQIGIAKDAADDLGLAYEEFTISSTNELQSVVTSMVGKVDAIYTPTDNMVANGISTVATIARENGIPLIVGEEALVEGGGLASVSVNYYELGRMSGQQAAQILRGEGEPATMPVQFQAAEDVALVVNEETAAALDITFPAEMLREATVVGGAAAPAAEEEEDASESAA